MKKTITYFTVLFLFFSAIVCGQNSNSGASNNAKFKVIKAGTKYSESQLTLALNKISLCGSFYESKTNDIEFDDGSIVRLFSKNQINSSEISSDCFVSDNYKFQKITWGITSNGYISKGYEIGPNKNRLN